MAAIRDCVQNGSPNGVNPDDVVTNKVKQKLACPWWNNACDRLVRLRKAAFLKFQFNMCRANLVNYKKCKAQVRKELKEIKKVLFGFL